MLLIYQCCQSCQTTGDESDLRVEWGDRPTVGAVRSMGGDRDWQVVEIVVYRSQNSIFPVCLIPVHPVNLAVPASEEWDCYDPDRNPREVLNIWFAKVREPQVYLEFNCVGEPPALGAFEQYYTQVEAGQVQAKVRTAPWGVQSVDTYLPIASAPYPAIHLAWCEPVGAAVA
jgi:hypothetical protein